MRLNKLILTVGLLLWGIFCFAQELAYAGNPDTSFFRARDLAFAGNRTVARDTLTRILTKYPEYTDVRNLLAKTLSWDGNYEKARKEFNRITSEERQNKEVWVAAINNEIYAKEDHIALGLVNKALFYLEADVDLLEMKESIINNIQPKAIPKIKVSNHEDARKEFNRITSVDRTNKAVWVAAIKNEITAQEYHIALGLANKALMYLKDDRDLLVMQRYATLYMNKPKKQTKATVGKSIAEKPKNNRVMVSNAFEVFDKVYESMIYTTVAYQRETKAGTNIP